MPREISSELEEAILLLRVSRVFRALDKRSDSPSTDLALDEPLLSEDLDNDLPRLPPTSR